MKAKVTILCLLAVIMGHDSALSVLTFDLNTPFNPSGIGSSIEPAWLTATFDDVAGGVQLTLSAPALPSGSYVTQWYFNIFQNNLLLPPLQLGQPTDPPLATYTWSPNNLNAGTPADTLGNGFDILMTFSSSGNLFESQDTATFLFSNPAGIIAEWFNQLNTAGNFFVAANTLSPTGTGSWIAATSSTTPGPAPVSEPATMILLSFGMAGLTFFGRKKLFV
jgi:hypothetical protein